MEKRKKGDLPTAMYKFRLYSGKLIELYGRNLYMLDDCLCKGAFTGDDFCDVSRRAVRCSYSFVPLLETPPIVVCS